MEIDTEKYKEKLDEALVEITEELSELGVQNPDNPNDWIATPEGVSIGEADPNVGADRVEEWNERRAILPQLETRYNNIRRALAKIESGTYGVCEISGEMIEEDRLDANPTARTSKAHIDEEKDLPL